MSKPFYNTINLEGEDLTKEVARVKKQEELILAIFKANPNVKFSPTQMLSVFSGKYHLHPPITSIRRGFSNLTDEGLLTKTEDKIPGSYHLPEHQWVLANPNAENIYKPEEASAADIACAIIAKSKPMFVQKSFF